jgi:hypothetical protein
MTNTARTGLVVLGSAVPGVVLCATSRWTSTDSSR